MKNEITKWILGAMTAALFALIAFVGSSFDTRITSADNEIAEVKERQAAAVTDQAVLKEILSQVNARTYEMSQQLDRIEKETRRTR